MSAFPSNPRDSTLSRAPRWPSLLLLGGILLLGLALRLYHINQPPTDYHCWRQTQTLMVAKSFHERDLNPLHPRVYWRNTTSDPVETEGIVGGTELQVTPWLTALLYKIFGTAYWVDRVFPIFFSLLGLAFFFLFTERMVGLAGAAAGTLLLCVSPMYLFFGRVHMPESFALAASFATFYYFERWLRTIENRSLFLAMLWCLLALLGKPTLALIALPLFFLVLLRYGSRFVFEWRLYLFGGVVGLLFLAYAWYSFKVLGSVSGLMFYAPGLVDRGMLYTREFYDQMRDSIWLRAVGWPLLLLALPALLLPFKRRDFFPHVWVIAVLLFFALAARGNFKNDYYQLALAPPAAYLAGLGVQRFLWRGYLRYAVVPLVLAAAYASLLLAQPMYADAVGDGQKTGENFLRAGQWIEQNTPEDALVVCAHPNPATLYFADRIGWTCWYEAKGNIPFNKETLDRMIALGATVLVVPDGDKLDDAYFPNYRETRDHLYENYRCHRGDNYAVFLLDQPADLSLPESHRIVFGELEARKHLRGRWGKDYYAEKQQAHYTDLRYDKTGGIRVDLPADTRELTLRVSSPVAGNKVSFSIDGIVLGSLDFPQAWAQADVVFDLERYALTPGPHTIGLETTQQRDNLISLLLWSVEFKAGQ